MRGYKAQSLYGNNTNYIDIKHWNRRIKIYKDEVSTKS